MIACFGHAWFDAWFGIDRYMDSYAQHHVQHKLGAILSLIWLILFLAIFNFVISFLTVGWLLIGTAFTGLTANVLRELHPDFSNPSEVEWWFKIKVPLTSMCSINVLILCIGMLLVIVF